MAGGILGMVPGMKQFAKVRSKLTGGGGGGGQKAAPPAPPTGPATPEVRGWAPRNGVNGTTNPKGVGKWGLED